MKIVGFFKVFEISETNGSLILSFFKELEPTIFWFWNI